MVDGERERLASEIWTGDFGVAMNSLRAANPDLVNLLGVQITNSTPTTEISAIHKRNQLDGILVNICRAQSIHNVPLLTAAISISCEANLVKRSFHDTISFVMKGALLSESWVEKFMPLANAHRPRPSEPMIPGIMDVPERVREVLVAALQQAALVLIYSHPCALRYGVGIPMRCCASPHGHGHRSVRFSVRYPLPKLPGVSVCDHIHFKPNSNPNVQSAYSMALKE